MASALLLWGCGGGGDDRETGGIGGSATSKPASGEREESESGSVTKAEFVKDAELLCKSGEEEALGEARASYSKYGIDPQKPPTRSQGNALVEDVILPSLQERAEELGELTPPAGDEAEVLAIVEGLEKGVAEAEAVPNKMLEAARKFDSVSKLARKYGIDACGRI
ncbi:MAG: hypothetical protein E6G51_03490 [Actinobacteria bacterium]|nr:MAG: hypothetical protein E6G51_03490 [Actinomycetota bacterium]